MGCFFNFLTSRSWNTGIILNEEKDQEKYIEKESRCFKRKKNKINVEIKDDKMPNEEILNQQDLAIDLENWMSLLPGNYHQIPIIHLAIPGSHDSFTYAITKKSKVAPDLDPKLRKLAKCSKLVPKIISRWSKTQNFAPIEQLYSGIRYFDIRIATKSHDELYIVHGLYSTAVRNALLDINDFLNSHSREVVILDFQHFYSMSKEDHEYLIEMINNIFKGKIVSFSSHRDMQKLTLEYLHGKGLQVFIIYRNSNFGDEQFFPSQYYNSPWPNVTSPDKLVKTLTFDLKTIRNDRFGYVSQFILTPTSKTIMKDCTGNLEKFCAIPLYEKKIAWVKSQTPGRGGVNVIIGDFIDIFDLRFTRTIINLNRKIFLQT